MEIPQLILAQCSETVVQPHQFRDPVLTEGPTPLPRFRAHKWCFKVRGNNSVRLTFHHFDTEEFKHKVLTELEHFLRTALQQLQQDGVASSDIIHIYLKCDGLDFDFAYNPVKRSSWRTEQCSQCIHSLLLLLVQNKWMSVQPRQSSLREVNPLLK